MNERDKAIVADIQRFRVLSRDLIADLHFQTNKDKRSNVNLVMKRLRRDGYVTYSHERIQYLYYPAENHIKKDGSKVNHFLQIAEFYRDICKIEKPRSFIVEPRYGPGMMEPDVFMIFKGMAWFVEIQRTMYSDKQIKAKFTRYDQYYLSDQWRKEPWQREERQIFPYVWLTGETGYNLGVRSYKVFQCSVEGMFELMNKQRQTRS